MSDNKRSKLDALLAATQEDMEAAARQDRANLTLKLRGPSAEILKLMKAPDFDPKAKLNIDNHPTFLIAICNNVKHERGGIIEKLIKLGASIDAVDDLGRNVLFYAYQGTMVEFLLDQKDNFGNKININAKDNSGGTALHFHASRPYYSKVNILIKCLLDQGLDPKIKNNVGKTALEVAKDSGNNAVHQFLTTYLAKADEVAYNNFPSGDLESEDHADSEQSDIEPAGAVTAAHID